MKKIQLLSVDMQRDFLVEGGKHFHKHSNIEFISNTLIPFCEKNAIKIAEIISDYRQPRSGDRDDSCNPGTIGYESEIPDNVKLNPVWIKCMNSPIWIRTGIGDSNSKAGIPYEDSKAFGEWLDNVIGKNDKVDIVLFGLTIDCCVLCTAQELSMRGYRVSVLKEGVDTYFGNRLEKDEILTGSVLRNWSTVINWKSLKRKLSISDNESNYLESKMG